MVNSWLTNGYLWWINGCKSFWPMVRGAMVTLPSIRVICCHRFVDGSVFRSCFWVRELCSRNFRTRRTIIVFVHAIGWCLDVFFWWKDETQTMWGYHWLWINPSGWCKDVKFCSGRLSCGKTDKKPVRDHSHHIVYPASGVGNKYALRPHLWLAIENHSLDINPHLVTDC